MLNLSVLDEPEVPVGAETGTTKMVKRAEVYPDPNQPRFEWESDKEGLTKLAESEKEHGILQPIVVRPRDSRGYMIRMGERRWRAAEIAELDEVPVIIEADDSRFDGFAQVAENRDRKDLTPYELAMFVKGKVEDEGMSKAEVARRSKLNASDITYLYALIDMPDYMTTLYKSGKMQQPKYFWELRKLAATYPDQVEQFCMESDDFTYRAIKEFEERLTRPEEPPVVTSNDDASSSGSGNTGGKVDAEGAGTENTGTENTGTTGGGKVDTESTGTTGGDKVNTEGSGTTGLDGDNSAPMSQPSSTYQIPAHRPEHENEARRPPQTDPRAIKKPLLLGNFDGRDVMVMLYTRPTTLGLVYVKYEDDGTEIEVDFGQVTNLTLTESQV